MSKFLSEAVKSALLECDQAGKVVHAIKISSRPSAFFASACFSVFRIGDKEKTKKEDVSFPEPHAIVYGVNCLLDTTLPEGTIEIQDTAGNILSIILWHKGQVPGFKIAKTLRADNIINYFSLRTESSK